MADYLAKLEEIAKPFHLRIEGPMDCDCDRATQLEALAGLTAELDRRGINVELVADGIIFHNTLASSDYGFLQHGTFEPRPNYWAVLLWNTLMGNTVYQAGTEGHVYCHSRKDGKDGYVYLIVNNDLENAMTVELPGEAEVYALAGRDGMRSSVMTLNGTELVAGPNGELPVLSGVKAAGSVEVAPGSCAFVVL